jgi:hypothetical protein
MKTYAVEIMTVICIAVAICVFFYSIHLGGLL